MLRRFLGNPIVALVLALILAGLGYSTHAKPDDAMAHVLFAAAVICAALAIIEWRGSVIWQRLPFTLRSPLIWKAPKPKPIRPVVEPGFLDHEKDYLVAMKEATKTLGAMNREMQKTNPKIVSSTAEMARVQGADVDKRLAATTRAARLVDRHASRMEHLEKTYREQTASMRRSLVDLLRTTPSSAADMGAFPDAIRKAGQQTTKFKSSTTGYRNATNNLRTTAVSQRLNQATDHLLAVLDLMIQDTDAVLTAYGEAEDVIAKRWPTQDAR